MSSVVLATAGYDHTLRLWEATSGICYRTLQYPESQINKLEITADKTQIAAAGNGQIRVFDVNSNDTQPINTFDGHTGNVTAVGFQKDSKWMYSGELPSQHDACKINSHVDGRVWGACAQQQVQGQDCLSTCRSGQSKWPLV